MIAQKDEECICPGAKIDLPQSSVEELVYRRLRPFCAWPSFLLWASKRGIKSSACRGPGRNLRRRKEGLVCLQNRRSLSSSNKSAEATRCHSSAGSERTASRGQVTRRDRPLTMIHGVFPVCVLLRGCVRATPPSNRPAQT